MMPAFDHSTKFRDGDAFIQHGNDDGQFGFGDIGGWEPEFG